MKRSSSFACGMVTGAALLGAGLFLGGMADQSSPPADAEFSSVTTKKLIVVDDAGRRMVLIGWDKEGGGVHAYDPAGVMVLGLGSYPAGGGLSAYDHSGKETGKVP